MKKAEKGIQGDHGIYTKKQPFFYTFINIDVRLQDLNLQSSDYEPDEITNFSKPR